MTADAGFGFRLLLATLVTPKAFIKFDDAKTRRERVRDGLSVTCEN